MVQVKESVGTAQKGSIKAVTGSGMASMSLASMDFQPRMEEPSKPNPSTNTSSVSSPTGTLKCCQVPKVSTNFTSTILAPCLRAISITLRADADGPAPLPLLDGFERIIFAGATERPGGSNLVPPFDAFEVVCFGISSIFKCWRR